jgi:hypothetical protein
MGAEGGEIVHVAGDDADAWYRFAEARHWGDGLPTLPPTEEAVTAFLAAAGLPEHDGDDGDRGPLPSVPPRGVRPTRHSFAANIVMAGGRPEYVPVIAAALRAVCEEPFNLVGVLATTHPCTPLVIVNGPARRALGINCEGNCLGQGTRANATIGRSLRLLLQNLGGAVPGELDLATHGTPAKFAYCFGENEERSPWAPFHQRAGFDADTSVVTVVAGEAPHNINDHGSESGDDLITTIAGTMSQVGSNNLLLGGPHVLVLGPEHATTLHGDGWTIADIQDALFERSRIAVDRVAPANRDEIAAWGRQPDGGSYTVGNTPDELLVVVAGGHGKHSLWIPSFAGTKAVSLPVGGLTATPRREHA